MSYALIELVVVFFLLPTLFAFAHLHVSIIPVLWVLFAYCLFILYRNDKLKLARLNPRDLFTFAKHTKGIIAILCVGSALIALAIWNFAPDILFQLPKHNPKLWSLIMLIYPLLSVYPQTVIYRAFFMSRYAQLFPSSKILILVSAFAFAYAHIVLRNYLAIVATFAAGLIFATRYIVTDSLFLCYFEHALYGCCMFTIGLGHWFYYGATFKG